MGLQQTLGALTKSYQKSDLAQNEFLVVLPHVIDLVPAQEREVSLQQLLCISAPHDRSTPLSKDTITMWLETEAAFIKQQKLIEELSCNCSG
jgi:hypothetical protein